MSFNNAEFGLRVRQLRLQKNMTQSELARALGLSVSFMGHIERGSRVASIATLYALSQALEVTTDYLLKGILPGEDVRITDEQIKVLRELRRAFSEDWFKE